MPDTLVSLQNAGRTYSPGKSPVVALASATCTVVSRDRIALVGRTGSGKSTLLHLMGGLDSPTSGSIAWPALGSRETLRPAKVGFVFQVPSLIAPLTVLENVEIPLLLDHVEPEQARAAAVDALKRIGLLPLADKLPEELSGGQAQRVAVARTLAYQPKLILADEPAGQLDHPAAQHLFDVLLACLEETDIALVVATHDMAIARRMRTVWHMEYGILNVEENT